MVLFEQCVESVHHSLFNSSLVLLAQSNHHEVVVALAVHRECERLESLCFVVTKIVELVYVSSFSMRDLTGTLVCRFKPLDLGKH